MEEEMERKLKDALDLCSFIRGADLGYVGDRMKVESMADALYELLSAPLPAAEPEPVAAGEVECLCNVNTQGSGDGTCPKCGPNLAAVLAALERLEAFCSRFESVYESVSDDQMTMDLALLRAHVSGGSRAGEPKYRINLGCYATEVSLVVKTTMGAVLSRPIDVSRTPVLLTVSLPQPPSPTEDPSK